MLLYILQLTASGLCGPSGVLAPEHAVQARDRGQEVTSGRHDSVAETARVPLPQPNLATWILVQVMETEFRISFAFYNRLFANRNLRTFLWSPWHFKTMSTLSTCVYWQTNLHCVTRNLTPKPLSCTGIGHQCWFEMNRTGIWNFRAILLNFQSCHFVCRLLFHSAFVVHLLIIQPIRLGQA